MLEVVDISKRFGEVVALDGVSLRVERGQLVGFLGPNGAGKTTTMRAIMQLLSLDGGAITWNGAPITPPTAGASATCRPSAACTRGCGCATTSCTTPGSAG